MPQKLPILNVLTIAGSDSGGASGIQADLKTFARFGLHGLSAVTAVTAQTLHEVDSVHCVPAEQVERQLRALFGGFRIDAVKIGMLGSAANVAAVARVLRENRARNIVLDPVLASSSGSTLLSARGLQALRTQLIPLADVLTPNLPEAALLLKRSVREADAEDAAGELLELGARAVLLKGGHGRGAFVRDVLVDTQGSRAFEHARLDVRARGTGCVLASAIAAGLAMGRSPRHSIAFAEQFLQRALRHSYAPTRERIKVLDVFAKI